MPGHVKGGAVLWRTLLRPFELESGLDFQEGMQNDYISNYVYFIYINTLHLPFNVVFFTWWYKQCGWLHCNRRGEMQHEYLVE